MDGVTLDLYRVFVQVAREGSFSAAARSLYLSQPAVSQAILHLERQLKATLFLRSVRGVTLTPEGALLFEHASAALDTLEAGQRKLETLHRLEAGALRVGAGDTATRYYLLPRLSRFSSRFPGLSLSVRNGTTGELLEYLRQGTIDLALISLPCDDADITVQPCLPIHDVFVCGAGQALSQGPVPLSRLREMRLIMLERQSSSRRLIDATLQEIGMPLSPEIELGSHDLLMDFAEAGLGVSCVVREFAAARLREGRLVELDVRPALPERAVGVAFLKDMPLPTAARRFLTELQEQTVLSPAPPLESPGA